MYYRSSGFKHYIRVFVDFGVNFDDNLLLTVFLDDAILLDKLLPNDKKLLYNIHL
jgi:hypothetical protein